MPEKALRLFKEYQIYFFGILQLLVYVFVLGAYTNNFNTKICQNTKLTKELEVKFIQVSKNKHQIEFIKKDNIENIKKIEEIRSNQKEYYIILNSINTAVKVIGTRIEFLTKEQ